MWHSLWQLLSLLQAPLAAHSVPATQPDLRCEVVGRVTDLAGAPIAGATVRCDRAVDLTTADLPNRPATRTGSEGRFVLRLPLWYPDTPGGVGLMLLAAAPGRASAWIELPLASAEDRPAPVDLGAIALPPGRAVRGVVLGRDGRPIAGARVRARAALTLWQGRLARWGEQTSSAANGTFLLPGVVAGPLTLEVRADGYASRTMTPVSGDDLVGVELAPTGFVTGRVVHGPTDPPFRGTVLLISEWSEDGEPARVHDDGSFRLPIPWLGRFCVAARMGDAACGQSEVLAGPATELKLAVTAPAGFRVRARDRESGAWIHEFRAQRVVLLGTSPPNLRVSRWGTAPDADGFACVGSGSGRPVPLPVPQKLLAGAPGYAGAMAELPHRATDAVVIDLSRGPCVLGRVVGSDGKSRANVRVTARVPVPRGYSTEPAAEVLTDAEGVFTIRTLWSGPFELFPTGPSGVSAAPVAITVDTAAKATPLELTLPDEVEVHGIASNAPPGARLGFLPLAMWEELGRRRDWATAVVPAHEWALVGADGHFRARATPAGEEPLVVAMWTPSPDPEEVGLLAEVARHVVAPAGEVALDLGPHRPATLRARISWNGPAEHLRHVALVARATPTTAWPMPESRLAPIQGGSARLRLSPGTWNLAFRDLHTGVTIRCDPDAIEATAGAELAPDLTLRAAVIDLRVEGPDHEPPLCQNLSVHCNQGPPRGRAAHADPVGPFLTRPGLDVRGLVGSIRFLVPTGDCRLAAQCGAARLAPYKQPRAENLIEVLLTDLKSGEIRAETLTLAAPLPIAR